MSNSIARHLQKSGLLVLDAHRNALDILFTARYLVKTHNVKVSMPLAGYVLHVPLMKQVTNWFIQTYQINFWPVYRREELYPTNLIMKFLCLFYPASLGLNERKEANRHFVQGAIETCQKTGQVVLVAPYGSPLWFGQDIKNGVRKILQSKATFIVSSSKWNWKKAKVTTKLGKLKQNKKLVDNKKIDQLVKNEFKSVITRC